MNLLRSFATKEKFQIKGKTRILFFNGGSVNSIYIIYIKNFRKLQDGGGNF